jgi:prolyl oligopeptidase
VVDTGIHSLKWDRQKAIDYFKQNAAKGENDIINEVDRYITWPGQALAYKIGELKIKELRAKSEKELADKFDLREFHDVILLGGALPLETLDKRVNDWLRLHNH